MSDLLLLCYVVCQVAQASGGCQRSFSTSSARLATFYDTAPDAVSDIRDGSKLLVGGMLSLSGFPFS